MGEDAARDQTSSAWLWHITNYATQAGTTKSLSWLRCTVEGRAGVELRLSAEPPPAGDPSDSNAPPTWIGHTGDRPAYGPYYCELGPVPAGRYTLSVEGMDNVISLWLDGTQPAAVTVVPAQAAPAAREGLPHVLLLGQMMTSQANFLALTRYVARFAAVVTFDPRDALRAGHAILIGSPQLVGDAVAADLQAAGVRVERAQGDIAAILDRAVAKGSPFLAD